MGAAVFLCDLDDLGVANLMSTLDAQITQQKGMNVFHLGSMRVRGL